MFSTGSKFYEANLRQARNDASHRMPEYILIITVHASCLILLMGVA